MAPLDFLVVVCDLKKLRTGLLRGPREGSTDLVWTFKKMYKMLRTRRWLRSSSAKAFVMIVAFLDDVVLFIYTYRYAYQSTRNDGDYAKGDGPSQKGGKACWIRELFLGVVAYPRHG